MQWLPFVVFPIVGAAVGAITNQIAIRMLFRPYQPLMMGRWRIPFTPGLIPQQRETIARNIAETFESNLLSGDDFHAILTSDTARQALETKLDDFLDQHTILRTMFRRHKPEVMARILTGLEEMGRTAVADGGALNIAQRIEARINEMDIEQLEELVLGFSRRQFRHITFFGGVLGAAIGLVQASITVFLHGCQLL